MMKKTLTTTLKTILGISLVTGCASDEKKDTTNPDSSSTSQRQQSVRSAEATGKLIALSNAAIGASSIGTRTNLVADLAFEIETGIDEYLEGIEDAECVDFTVSELADGSVDVSIAFDSCLGEAGDLVSGTLDISVDDDEAGIDCDYEGDLQIDGASVDGSWSVDIDEGGVAIVAGAANITLADGGGSLSVQIDASWEDLDGLCPQLTQHLDVTLDGSSVSIDFGGFDLCSTSFCGSDVDILIEDADGLAEVDFSASGVSVDGLGEGFVCGEDGDLDWDEDLDGLDDLDELDELGDLDETGI